MWDAARARRAALPAPAAADAAVDARWQAVPAGPRHAPRPARRIPDEGPGDLGQAAPERRRRHRLRGPLAHAVQPRWSTASWSLNPGSVGQPRDGDPRAAYAVIDDNKIELKRVAYPVEETIARIEASAAARARQADAPPSRSASAGCTDAEPVPDTGPSRPSEDDGMSRPDRVGPALPRALRVALRGPGGGRRLLLQFQQIYMMRPASPRSAIGDGADAWRSCRSSSSSSAGRSPTGSTCSGLGHRKPYIVLGLVVQTLGPRRAGAGSTPAGTWSLFTRRGGADGDGPGSLRHLLRRHGHRRHPARRPPAGAGDAHAAARFLAAMVCSLAFGAWLEGERGAAPAMRPGALRLRRRWRWSRWSWRSRCASRAGRPTPSDSSGRPSAS